MSNPHRRHSEFLQPRYRWMFGGCKILCVLGISYFLASCAVVSDVPEISNYELQQEVKKQLEFAERTMIERTHKLANLSWPILVHNLEMCEDFVQHRTGMWLSRKSSILTNLSWVPEDEQTIGEDPVVWGVADDSPAARAGLEVGDHILAIDSKRVKSSADARRLLAKSTKEFAAERTDPIQLLILRDDERKSIEVKPVLACRSEISLAGGTRFNAYATGRHIKILNGIFTFVETDEELQYVIAHELAHNISNHVVYARARGAVGIVFDLLALRWNVWTNGGISRLTVQAFTKPYEVEADYLALYLLANAGIDSTGVENLWRRLATDDISRIGWNLTHPSTPERFIQLQKTREEIEAKQRRNEKLLPERK
ncbi:MAG: M48 family metalloprotease [Gammaproteobacteria bacterium]|nr:M48 family metalloprotease [Gammaproteobacteria bacterium]MYF02170.1 M48 family metalloprotease [Gammaproteobacteria bacterium]MYI77532.1 M48 family metalloprotease [Gammaproteobacteria bacterium]